MFYARSESNNQTCIICSTIQSAIQCTNEKTYDVTTSCPIMGGYGPRIMDGSRIQERREGEGRQWQSGRDIQQWKVK